MSHWAGLHSLAHLSSERVKAWTEGEWDSKQGQNSEVITLSRPEVMAAGMEAGGLKEKTNPWHWGTFGMWLLDLRKNEMWCVRHSNWFILFLWHPCEVGMVSRGQATRPQLGRGTIQTQDCLSPSTLFFTTRSCCFPKLNIRIHCLSYLNEGPWKLY